MNSQSTASGKLRSICLVLVAAAAMPGTASAQAGEELVNLINGFRGENRQCEGRDWRAAGPLAPQPRLAQVQVGAAGDVRDALRKQGYLPARFQAISLSGPGSPGEAMDLLRQRYCAPLMDANYADIGVAREGTTWRIVLARPVLAPDLGDWGEAGREILKLTNQARSQARTCGRRQFGAAPPLAWSQALGAASLAHSRDMAAQNYFEHLAKDGSGAGERVERQGYDWRHVGENIASGQGSPQQAVAAWIASPTHCANLMNPDFRQMGAAYAVDPKSDHSIYWTQVFATPR